MKVIHNKVLALAALVLSIQSCKPDLEAPSASKGKADFSKYLAVGNSLTAGYASGGLYESGQINSYPNILAGQFREVGGGDFNQPIMAGNGTGYITLNGISGGGSASQAPILGLAPQDPSTVAADYVKANGERKTRYAAYTGDITSLSNLGIPGIRISDVLTAGYGLPNDVGFNPFYDRLLPAPITPEGKLRTYASFVGGRNHTFFTNWLGNNDVLGYASEGAASSFMTDLSTFQANYKAILDTLTRNGAKGVCVTIPNVTATPYFTTVAYNPAALNETEAALLQFGFSGNANGRMSYNDSIRALNRLLPANSQLDTIRLQAGRNAPLIRDSSDIRLRDLGYKRQARQGDLILLPAAAVLPTYFRAGTPLDNKYVLTPAEQFAIKSRTDEYNIFIKTEAQARGLAVVDVTTFLDSPEFQGGTYMTDGVGVTPIFLSGGAFSLDGIHLTPRGYALVANLIIKAINNTYQANIKPVSLGQYPGVTFPK